jgi:ketosteroid isomerase-like protein
MRPFQLPAYLCVLPALASIGALPVPTSVLRTPSIVLMAPGYASADANALTKLDDEWSKVAATKDAEKTVAFYADNAIVYPPSEPVAVGRAAAKKVWATCFALPDLAISWKTTHAEASASSDLGYTTGTYEYTCKGPDGKPVVEKGKYVCIWK